MTDLTLHPTPRTRDVVREQVRTVGLAVRREAVVLAVLVGLLTLVVFSEVVSEGAVVTLQPGGHLLIAALGFLLPFAVWKGGGIFSGGYLWALPVDRRRHALAKSFGGWTWLMVATGVYVLLVLALSLLSGGFGAGETLFVLPPGEGLGAADLLARGEIDPSELTSVRWTTPLWQWVVPFTAATVGYLFGSAVLLGLKHRLRWLAGILAGLAVLGVVGEEGGVEWMDGAFETAVEVVVASPYGLDTALTTGGDLQVVLPGGESLIVWHALPDPGRWLAATLLWIGIGLVALWAAASRHRES